MPPSPSTPPAAPNPPHPAPTPPPHDEAPGMPGFRTWRGVYLFVLAVFVAIVIALTIFTRVYA